MYRRSVSSDQDPENHHICLSTIQIVSTQTKGLTNTDSASRHIACHALSCPIIMHLTNGSLSIFLKDVLAMKQFSTRPPYKCLEPLNTFPAHVYFMSNRP